MSLPKTPLYPAYSNLVLPGITASTSATVTQLLKKNHDSHHIFHGNHKFHNHLTHHLLTAYSFGADEKRLEEIYKIRSSIQQPRPPELAQRLTRDNYHDRLGDASAYTSFLRLFEEEIEQHGIYDTTRRWVFSGDMLNRLMSGAYHPLIHVGYGIEFELPGQLAEGLALAACSENQLSPWMKSFPEVRDKLVPVPDIPIKPLRLHPSDTDANDKDVLLNILQEIHQDAFFDNLIEKDDKDKYPRLIGRTDVMEKLHGYAKKWTDSRRWQTKRDIEARMKELYTTAVVAYSATAFPDDKQDEHLNLDFFLMHGLTSSYFAFIFMPHVLPEEMAALLQAHWLTTLTFYVAGGRPAFKMDQLFAYVAPSYKAISTQPAHRQWMQVLADSVYEEEHVAKAIRASGHAQILYGDDPQWFDFAVYLKAAQMSYEMHDQWFRTFSKVEGTY